jgi:D-beta-D-heptose 7-phosphate kinase/D-beta-D-heptose 1-phosphate adenosyltransferase
MDLAKLQQILDRAASQRILVIGDLMLDEFVWGKVGRISPEAPVPVVEVTRESFCPGGAANVARNLREFIDDVAIVGMVGKDHHGQHLRQLLSECEIDVDLIEEASFQTIVKTRIIARHQQVVRVDREKISALTEKQTAKVLDVVRGRLAKVDAIIFEDYGKGFLSGDLVARIAAEANAAAKITAADPNPRNPIDWRGMTVVKPNRSEAFSAAGIREQETGDEPQKDEDLNRAGHVLLEKWQTKHVLITLGEHGMMLFSKGDTPFHVSAKARDVFDVSGAGDTAIALFTLALTGGASPVEAAEIANNASAVVVGKLGTATVSRDELVTSFRNG